MTRSFWSRIVRRLVLGVPARRPKTCLGCEALEDRTVPATLDTFLTAEHVDLDIGYTGGATGTWSLGAFDEDNGVDYTADEALLYVGTPALEARPASSAFDFVGVGGGAEYYRLPQSQDADILYLGVEADVTASDFDQYNLSTESKGRITSTGRWVKVTLVGVDHVNPNGTAGTGVFSAWQDVAGGPNVFMSSFNDGTANPNANGLDATDGIGADDALWVVAGGHNHYNYGFTQPGRYEVTFRLSGYQNDGNTTSLGTLLQSGDVTVVFSVNSVGQIAFDAPSYSVNEGAGTATITATRTGGSDGEVTINYATSDGSATAGSDYTTATGTLTFLDGETTKTFTVPVTDDTAAEANETINLTLSAAGPSSINGYLVANQSDPNGLLGATTAATLTVFDNDEPPGNAPTISDVAVQNTNEDTPTGAIGFTVGDVETPAANLNVTATSSNAALVPNGNLVLGGSGTSRTLTVTPAANASGTATITLTVTDGAGQTATDTFLLTVSAVNDVPVATPQSITLNEDAPTPVTLAGTDVEGSPLTYTIVSGPANGTLTGTGAARTYTPNANFSGTDSFTFMVNDGTADSATATVSIIVTAVNDAPAAAAESFAVGTGNAIRGNVLLNDTDAEGSALTASVVTNPMRGTLTLNPNGTFTYTPNATFAGTDSFTYRASDGTAQSAVTTVSFTAAGFQDFDRILTTEHVEFGLGFDGAWDLHLHNEDAEEEYEPDSSLLAVVSEALTPRTGAFAGAAFDFLGTPVGGSFYLLPAVQDPEILYLGIGSEEIVPGDFLNDQVTLRLLSVNGPGQFSMWENTAGGPSVLMATSDGITAADAVVALADGEAHYNIAFTARGRYEVTFEASGTLADGTPTSSGPVTYYVSVDNLGRVQFSTAAYSATEGGTATVTVTRTGGSDGPLTVNYATGNGTATAGSDYTAASGTLTFNDGEAVKTFTVATATDPATEANETVNLGLTAPSGTTLGTPAAAVLTISDPPPMPPPADPIPTNPTPTTPNPIVAPPAISAAIVFNGFVFLLGPTGQVASALPAPSGTSALFADVTGDGKGDAIVFFTNSVLVMNGQTGRIHAFATDLDGDRVPELFLFAPDGSLRSVTLGRTGQVISLV